MGGGVLAEAVPDTASGVTPQAIHCRASATPVTNTRGSETSGRRSSAGSAALPRRWGRGRARRRRGRRRCRRRRAAWKAAKRSSRPARHPGVLRATAGKEESDAGASPRRRRPVAPRSRIAATQLRHPRSRWPRPRGGGSSPAARRQRVGDIGQVDGRVGLEVVGETLGRGVERGVGRAPTSRAPARRRRGTASAAAPAPPRR